MCEGINLDGVDPELLFNICKLYEKADDATLNAAALLFDAEILSRRDKENVTSEKTV